MSSAVPFFTGECGGAQANDDDTKMPVYFSLTAPWPEAHAELITMLQSEIVVPLVERGLVLEFRVLSATPPTFVAESATLVVFEFIVPCPWSVTELDVQRWQRHLGPRVRLAIVTSGTGAGDGGIWAAGRSRSTLERAMAYGLSFDEGKGRRRFPGEKGWLGACVDRKNGEEGPVSRRREHDIQPILNIRDERTGRRLRLPPGSTLVSEDVACELCQCLPTSVRWRSSWRLVYAPKLHGISLRTFHRRMEEEGPSLVIIQDHSGCVFGGYASTPWTVGERYYGTGECFVFTFAERLPKPAVPLSRQMELLASGRLPVGDELPAEVASPVHAHGERQQQPASPTARTEATQEAIRQAVESLADNGAATAESSADQAAANASGSGYAPEERENDDGDLGLEVFGWKSGGRDTFFQYSDGDCVGMGGGSAFAFYLDRDLLHGISEACSTFGSRTLSSTENFAVGDMEVWVFDDPTKPA